MPTSTSGRRASPCAFKNAIPAFSRNDPAQPTHMTTVYATAPSSAAAGTAFATNAGRANTTPASARNPAAAADTASVAA